MPDNFQQTVDLREQMEKRRKPVRPARLAGAIGVERASEPAAPSGESKKAVTPIEKVYRDGEPSQPIKNLQKISRPETRGASDGLVRLIIFILAIAVVIITVYFLFFRQKGAAPAPLARDWYAVKLVDGEIFYGQIADVKADPIFIANVYYNYDQKKLTAPEDKSKTILETGNIRLVKRGKETHGPDGSMNVVRAQVLFMEPLKAESKVLQAILEYEK